MKHAPNYAPYGFSDCFSATRARFYILFLYDLVSSSPLNSLYKHTLTHTHTFKRVCVLPATRTGRILNLINLKRLRRRCILLLGLALSPCCCCCHCFCFRWRCDAIRLAQCKIWKQKLIKSNQIRNQKSEMRIQNSGARGLAWLFPVQFPRGVCAMWRALVARHCCGRQPVATIKMQSMLGGVRVGGGQAEHTDLVKKWQMSMRSPFALLRFGCVSSLCSPAVLVLALFAFLLHTLRRRQQRQHTQTYIFICIVCMLDILSRQVKVGGKLEGSCVAY